MFEQTFLVGTGKTRRAWTVPAGFAAELLAVGCMVLTPLVFFDALPQARLAPPQVTAPGLYRPQPQRPNFVHVVGTRITPSSHQLVAPTLIPDRIDPRPDEASAPPEEAGPACNGPCVPGGFEQAISAIGFVAPPVKLPEPPAAMARVEKRQPEVPRLRVQSTVQEAMLVNRVTPAYPRLAIMTRASGVVHLAAVIGTDGRIRELQVLPGSHPMFIDTTLSAVRQWIYRPTMLNGSPVEVMTDITVTFHLTRN